MIVTAHSSDSEFDLHSLLLVISCQVLSAIEFTVTQCLSHSDIIIFPQPPLMMWS